MFWKSLQKILLSFFQKSLQGFFRDILRNYSMHSSRKCSTDSFSNLSRNSIEEKKLHNFIRKQTYSSMILNTIPQKILPENFHIFPSAIILEFFINFSKDFCWFLLCDAYRYLFKNFLRTLPLFQKYLIIQTFRNIFPGIFQRIHTKIQSWTFSALLLGIPVELSSGISSKNLPEIHIKISLRISPGDPLCFCLRSYQDFLNRFFQEFLKKIFWNIS